MKALENRDPFRLGLGAVAAIAVLALVILVLSKAEFNKSTYTALVSQSAGLKAAEDVQIAGVSVGKVKGVELNGDNVKVTFSVDSGVHLGNQTSAAIKVATLLGTHLLAITPAGSGSLANGQIPLDRTSVPFNLQDVLNQGTKALEQLDTPKLAQLMTTMTNELTPSSQDLGPALQGVVDFSRVIASHTDQIGALLTAAKSVTQQLSGSSGDLLSLMQQTNLVVKEVTSRRDAIDALLVQTTQLASAVNGIIGATKADVGPALAALNGTLAELRNQDGLLRHVLDVMAPATRYLANATGNGPYADLWNHGNLLPPNDGCHIPGVSC